MGNRAQRGSCAPPTTAKLRAAPTLIRRVLCLALTAGLVSVSAPTQQALAQSKDDLTKAETLALQAKFKFKAGEFAAAAELYITAFTLGRKPALLFNAARAYEEAQRYREAKAAFEQFLSLAGSGESGRDDAKARIEALEAKIAAEAATPPAQPTQPTQPTPTDKAPQQPPTQTAPGAQPAAASQSPTLTAQAPSPEGPSKILSWSLVGGGSVFALIALATIGGGVARADAANAMDFAAVDAKTKYKAEFDAAEGSVTGGAVFLVVGLGLAGWGAWRLMSTPASPAPVASARVWASPTLLPGPDGVGSGLIVGGSF